MSGWSACLVRVHASCQSCLPDVPRCLGQAISSHHTSVVRIGVQVGVHVAVVSIPRNGTACC